MSKTKHPNHYNEGKKLETWDWIEQGITDEQFEGYLMGNVLKYLHRHEGKGGSEDLEKAIVYIKKLREYKYDGKEEPDKIPPMTREQFIGTLIKIAPVVQVKRVKWKKILEECDSVPGGRLTKEEIDFIYDNVFE